MNASSGVAALEANRSPDVDDRPARSRQVARDMPKTVDSKEDYRGPMNRVRNILNRAASRRLDVNSRLSGESDGGST
jgi:hypothetical protein